jgi:hypothetical protein
MTTENLKFAVKQETRLDLAQDLIYKVMRELVHQGDRETMEKSEHTSNLSIPAASRYGQSSQRNDS